MERSDADLKNHSGSESGSNLFSIIFSQFQQILPKVVLCLEHINFSLENLQYALIKKSCFSSMMLLQICQLPLVYRTYLF
jgi:hypothetical protein